MAHGLGASGPVERRRHKRRFHFCFRRLFSAEAAPWAICIVIDRLFWAGGDGGRAPRLWGGTRKSRGSGTGDAGVEVARGGGL